jgi:hypothetical protein
MSDSHPHNKDNQRQNRFHASPPPEFPIDEPTVELAFENVAAFFKRERQGFFPLMVIVSDPVGPDTACDATPHPFVNVRCRSGFVGRHSDSELTHSLLKRGLGLDAGEEDGGKGSDAE